MSIPNYESEGFYGFPQPVFTPAVPRQWQNPQYTFFVSPSFDNVSPYFSTIANAMAAADGTNMTIIYLFAGTHTALALAIKNNVFITGCDRSGAVIDQAGAGVTFETAVATTHTCGLSNLTMVGTASASIAFRITINAGGVSTSYCDNVTINLTLAGATCWQIDNNVATTTHSTRVTHCYFQTAGGNACITLNKPIAHFIDNCTLRNGTGNTILCAFMTTNFDKLVVSNTTLGAVSLATGGTVGVHSFYNCVFENTITIPAASSEIWRFYGCHFIACGLTTSNANTGFYYFQNCTFTGVQGADTTMITCTVTGPTLKFYNVAMHNGKFSFGASNVKCTFVNVVVYNPNGAACIAVTAGAPNVMLGNFSSDMPLAAAVALNALSFNVQLGVPI